MPNSSFDLSASWQQFCPSQCPPEPDWMGETLVVIDAQVDAIDQLLTLLRPNMRAIALQPDQDGVAQITAAVILVD